MPLINNIIRTFKRKYDSNKRDNLNAVAVYNTGTWRKLRVEYLKEHPLCGRCEKKGFLKLAEHVHHIVELSNGKNLMEKRTIGFDMNNLEGLCKECHTQHHINKNKRLI